MERKTAFEIAISAIEHKQYQFIVGHNTHVLLGGGPATLYFTNREHKLYERLEDAKRILEAAAEAE